MTSSAPRSSTSIAAPSGVAGSTVVSGATTRNGTPAWRAASASEKLPTLFAVSPLAAIRSAPMSTTSASPRAEHRRRRAVDEQPERRAHPLQLPRGEPGALEQRPRLERERLLEAAARVQLAR